MNMSMRARNPCYMWEGLGQMNMFICRYCACHFAYPRVLGPGQTASVSAGTWVQPLSRVLGSACLGLEPVSPRLGTWQGTNSYMPRSRGPRPRLPLSRAGKVE